MLTEAAGGEFYDLAGPKSDLAFCPLRDIDDDADLTWAVGWIEALCELNGLKFTPRHRNAVAEAVMQPAAVAHTNADRTLRERAGHGDPRRAAALHRRGPARLAAGCRIRCPRRWPVLRFETENLLQLDDKAVIPVLLYLFRRIEQRLDGSPTLILLDEAWSYLQHELFRDRLKDWLKTMRRKNAVVVMATQQISDIANSDIADVVLENCPTKILLPNAEAKNPGSREFYTTRWPERAGTGNLQVSIPKQHYYVVSKLGRRLVDLGVGKVALSWVGVNGERRASDRRERHGALPRHVACRVAAIAAPLVMGRLLQFPRRRIEREEEAYVCARA